jgi:hypothetical protein
LIDLVDLGAILACREHLRRVLDDPTTECVERFRQRFSEGRERVVDPRRHLAEVASRNEPILLERS